MTGHVTKPLGESGTEHWDIIIKPSGNVSGRLTAAWKYRELVWMFFKRDFTTFYKQTVLGPVWYLIQPTLTAITYYIVFGKIANLSTDGISPLVFYMSGTIIWNYFSACLTNNAETFSKNSNLFGKVYFPRLVVPLAVAMSSLVAFVIQFMLLLLITFAFWLSQDGMVISPRFVLATPLILAYVATLGVGAGLAISALTVRYRDLVYAVGFVAQLWMYATPVVYTFSQVPERYQWFYHLNPMTTPVQLFRWALFDSSPLPLSVCLANVFVTLVVLICGLMLFARAEATAMDTV
ncbi:polysaccharide ABC transporter permease protein [Rhizobium phaseoli]|nr:polysaccharide ABC transporter permease protein [Rhizobium phaseoli]